MIHRGDLTATEEDKDYCDKVTVVTGDAVADVEGAFPMLTIVGGSAYANAKGAFPMLTKRPGDTEKAFEDAVKALIKERAGDTVDIDCAVAYMLDHVDTVIDALKETKGAEDVE